MVFHLIIFPILSPSQVYDSLHVTSGHLHDHGHAYLSVDGFLFELVAKCSVGHILHIYVDSGHQVMSILGLHIHQTYTCITHLGTMHNARFAPQDAVITQFQSVLGLSRIGIQVAQGASGQ